MARRKGNEKNVDKIIICKHCGKPEYYGEMRWLNGRCSCRNCYKSQWQDENHKLYSWDDLDGKRPTMEEYEKQEGPLKVERSSNGEINRKQPIMDR